MAPHVCVLSAGMANRGLLWQQQRALTSQYPSRCSNHCTSPYIKHDACGVQQKSIGLCCRRCAPRLRCLVVLPTRDLAAQVFRVFAGLCPAAGLRAALAAAQASVAAEAAEAFGGHLEAPCPGMHSCSDNCSLLFYCPAVPADDAVLGWESCRTTPAVT